MELLDFNLPPCEWSEVNPAKLSAFMPGTNAVQIGRVLSKLSEDDKRVLRKRYTHHISYVIPLKKHLINR